jgi:hypothetical protein
VIVAVFESTVPSFTLYVIVAFHSAQLFTTALILLETSTVTDDNNVLLNHVTLTSKSASACSASDILSSVSDFKIDIDCHSSVAVKSLATGAVLVTLVVIFNALDLFTSND